MVKFRKILAVATAALTFASVGAFPANASTDWDGVHNSYYKTAKDRTPDSGYRHNYAAQIYANTKLKVDVGWVTNCNVKSKGSSVLRYIKQNNTTKNSAVLASHNITTHIGGIGGGNLSLSASGSPSVGGGFTWGGKDASKNYTTATVYYSTDASIWRLYEYSETHSGHFVIKNAKKKNLCSIEASCRVSY